MTTSIFKNTALAVLSLASLSLCSCGTNSIPAKGYKKFKNYISTLLDANGYSKNAMKYSSCSYVWITGDGSQAAGILKDCVCYQIYGSLNINGFVKPILTYALYSDIDGTVGEMEDSTTYNQALMLVNGGYLSGKTGTLK